MKESMDGLIAEWSERIRAAAAGGHTLHIRGGGSKDFYGRAVTGERLDTGALRGIVSHEPSELVVTVRAGTALAELEAELATAGQMLAFEPPHFGSGATVGGMVAAGLSGPRRASAGALRDFVLGVRMLDGRGEVGTTVIAPVNAFWHNPFVERFEFDMDAARAELEAAGYSWDAEGRLQR